ncbi:DUF1540 domain-containing protein [Sporomusa aerivorans]|uniref:DUF1540 domain-containing protein n=1 Tax=Sporomusa aerivorans TaxID=204936 RepID=UPI00352BB0F6
MSKVTKCMCEECHHNNNFKCTADGIEVRSSGDVRVQTADGTACNTFKTQQR